MTPRTAYVCTDSWAGRMEWACFVIAETPKRYRIRAAVDIELPRRRLKQFDTALVPKRAVRFT